MQLSYASSVCNSAPRSTETTTTATLLVGRICWEYEIWMDMNQYEYDSNTSKTWIEEVFFATCKYRVRQYVVE